MKLDFWGILILSIPLRLFLLWAVWITVNYIIPNHSIIEGLSEWYHESDGDI